MIKDFFSAPVAEMMADDAWVILQDKYDPAQNVSQEALFGLSNGYMGTRGAYEEGTTPSLPFTAINGVFDKSETFMRELANMPNWLGIKLYVEKQLLGIETCEVLEFCRALDMQNALLARHMKLRDKKGRETIIDGVRILSRTHPHYGAILLWVTPCNYDGILEVESILDASVINFADAPRFKVKHTSLVKNETISDKSNSKNGCYLEVKTRDFEMPIGMGAKIALVNSKGESVEKSRAFSSFGETAIEFKDCDIKQGETLEVHKLMSVYAGRDFDIKDQKSQELSDVIKENVTEDLSELKPETIKNLIMENKEAYSKMWDQADICIDGDDDLNRAIRFNIFQLMSTASETDNTVNVGAKLLHGEEYGGHAFWDTELFMLPFFSYVFPKTANNLVRYRYHLLDAARQNAKRNGYSGAQYPWESADTGDEQCPDWTIEPDGSCYRCWVATYEHHVTADIAVGAYYNYHRVTGDNNYLLECGAEILLETARFWASRFEYDSQHERYQITQVTGPDEWHEPVDNNIYTNYLAKWNLEIGLEVLEKLKKDFPEDAKRISGKIGLTKEETENWIGIIPKVYLPMNEEGLFEQFEGYFQLKNLVIQEYNEKDMPVRPPEMKGMRMSETQFIKQADVVMLLYLMGDRFSEETQLKNYEYYEKRTMHGSSLSPSVYAMMGLRVGRPDMAYRYLRRSAFLDLNDLQHNTREGIHAANSGGVWGSVVFGFGGVRVDDGDILCIEPKMPDQWKNLSFRLHFRGRDLKLEISGGNQVKVERIGGEPLNCKIYGKIQEV